MDMDLFKKSLASKTKKLIAEEAWTDASITRTLKSKGGSTAILAKKLDALKSPLVTKKHLALALWDDSDEKVSLAAVHHPKADDDIRAQGLASSWARVTLAAAEDPKTKPELIQKAIDEYGHYRPADFTQELTAALKKKLHK